MMQNMVKYEKLVFLKKDETLFCYHRTYFFIN